MPNSIRENNNDVRAFVATHDIQDALDVGPGEGTYHMLLGDLIPEIDGVEIWYKNIVDFSLKNRYRDVWNDDIRGFEYIMNYDLIIFGDVLEHMSVVEAITVFLEAKKHAKWCTSRRTKSTGTRTKSI
jgi:predicted TPR repeat methyltransferase